MSASGKTGLQFARYQQHGYAAAIRSGDLLFVWGQTGSRANGTPEPHFTATAKMTFANLTITLAAAGCTFDDLTGASG